MPREGVRGWTEAWEAEIRGWTFRRRLLPRAMAVGYGPGSRKLRTTMGWSILALCAISLLT